MITSAGEPRGNGVVIPRRINARYGRCKIVMVEARAGGTGLRVGPLIERSSYSGRVTLSPVYQLQPR